MCNGCGIIIGQLYGAQKIDKLRRATAVMLMFGVGLGVLLTLGVTIGIEPLMRLLNTPESVFGEAMRYAAVVCGGVGVTILYNMCASFMRSLGNGRMPLVFLTISCVLNIALDTLFVVVLHIGVVGTALATLIAQCISALLSMAYIARAFKPFLPRKADFRAPAGLWTQMAASGLSMGLMNSVLRAWLADDAARHQYAGRNRDGGAHQRQTHSQPDRRADEQPRHGGRGLYQPELRRAGV